MVGIGTPSCHSIAKWQTWSDGPFSWDAASNDWSGFSVKGTRRRHNIDKLNTLRISCVYLCIWYINIYNDIWNYDKIWIYLKLIYVIWDMAWVCFACLTSSTARKLNFCETYPEPHPQNITRNRPFIFDHFCVSIVEERGAKHTRTHPWNGPA